MINEVNDQGYLGTKKIQGQNEIYHKTRTFVHVKPGKIRNFQNW